jgi:2-amino-4-hydroxy-6-hydroxymethyldihydropteridine diphosphokinase
MARDLSNARTCPEQGVTVLLALGSNLGDRRALLREGTRRLSAGGDLIVEAASALYASAPVDADGGEFLNAVIRVRTSLAPAEVLRRAKAIERDLGRTGQQGDARPLDVDVLYFGDGATTAPDLVVPHPRRLDRPFVLVPLLEVCGTMPEPGTNRTVADSVADLAAAGRGTLRRVEGPSWLDGME